MYIWPVTAVVSGQSRLGDTKMVIFLNIALISYFHSCVKDRDLKKKFGESVDTNKYPIKTVMTVDRSLADFLSGLDRKHIS